MITLGMYLAIVVIVSIAFFLGAYAGGEWKVKK